MTEKERERILVPKFWFKDDLCEHEDNEICEERLKALHEDLVRCNPHYQKLYGFLPTNRR